MARLRGRENAAGKIEELRIQRRVGERIFEASDHVLDMLFQATPILESDENTRLGFADGRQWWRRRCA